MSDDRYHIPRLPPGPPLAGLLEHGDPSVSFRSADRRERTDPFGHQRAARPDWIDPTPSPAARAFVPPPNVTQPSVPPEMTPRRRTSAWAWIAGGMMLGTFLLLAAFWVVSALDVDEEGLLPVASETVPSLRSR